MRILVVDDSAFMRKAISQMISSDPSLQVVGTARNGLEAVELAKKLAPDLITLDIEMPEMDGLTALRHIMRQSPTVVLMFSSMTGQASNTALRALNLGAADILIKDIDDGPTGINRMRDELLEHIHALNPAKVTRKTQPSPPTKEQTTAQITDQIAAPSASLVSQPVTHDPLPTFRPNQFDVVCIGASTGGPPVLETLLAHLPEQMCTPIVVAQHMPYIFTQSLAHRLDQQSSLGVHHAHDGQLLEPANIYIAPGGKQTHLEKVSFGRWKLRVNELPGDSPYKPSVNVLFNSAAAEVGRRTLAIVLSGIGEDGLVGARSLHEKGGVILAQNAQSCVVYGMPKAVTEAGLAIASLTPEQLHQTLLQLA